MAKKKAGAASFNFGANRTKKPKKPKKAKGKKSDAWRAYVGSAPIPY